MSSHFIVLCVILILVSAFVAYLGDLLGRHIGKRRIKLFGLRPRVSAIVVTAITGGLITLLTILVLVATSQTVRNMARRASELMQLEREARTKTADAEQEVMRVEAEIKRISDEQQSLLKRLGDAHNELESTTVERDRIADELKKLDETVEDQRKLALHLRGEVDRLDKRRQSQQREIEANTAYILEQESALTSLRQQTAQLTQRVEEYREGEIVVPEGTRLAGGYFTTTDDRRAILEQLLLLKNQVELPGGVTPVWPASAQWEAAVDRIQARQPEPLAAVILEAAENALKGGTMQVNVRVLSYVEIFRAGDIILLWRIEKPLDRREADVTAQTILTGLSQKAIERGAIPLMGDGRLTLFDSLSFGTFVTDLLEAQPPAYCALQAARDIGALDLLKAEDNVVWRMVPAGAAGPR